MMHEEEGAGRTIETVIKMGLGLLSWMPSLGTRGRRAGSVMEAQTRRGVLGEDGVQVEAGNRLPPL